MLFLVNCSLVKKERKEGELLCYNCQFFCRYVWDEVLGYFHTIAVKLHNNMRNWLFCLPGRIFVNNPLDVKEK
jgi:hypothetical protein